MLLHAEMWRESFAEVVSTAALTNHLVALLLFPQFNQGGSTTLKGLKSLKKLVELFLSAQLRCLLPSVLAT